VKLSRDGVAMLLHDATLERTTNGKGRAADLPWAELTQLDAGSWHSPRFAGERIPSFEEARGALQLARHEGAHRDQAHAGIRPETGRQRRWRRASSCRGAPVPPSSRPSPSRR
jgi:glycerophosphoryl diester phosphodiesterase